MELTKEYFEQYIAQQFDAFELKMDAKLDAKLDDKLGAQTRELKAYVHDSFEVQQNYIDERIEELVKNMKFSIDLN